MTDEWRVLLIGGNSGAGKTVAAQALARSLAMSVLLVDDVRLALQESTGPSEHPDLHVFLGYQPAQWLVPESIRDDWIRVGRAMLRPLKAIIAHHVVVTGVGPVMLEGDGILPALAAQSGCADLRHFQGLELGREVRAVFVVELDEAQLLHNLRARGRGFTDWDPETQAAFAHASRLYGEWLAAEAQALALPVLAGRPYDTLPERILAEIAAKEAMMLKQTIRVIADYQAAYADPISVKAGDEVALGKRDSEWPGWVWCTGPSGKCGWVPEAYIEPRGSTGIMQNDYSAIELTVRAGETLTAEQIESDWAWAVNAAGQRGWVPLSHLRVEPAPADDTQTAAAP